jgi:hypothetical protein
LGIGDVLLGIDSYKDIYIPGSCTLDKLEFLPAPDMAIPEVYLQANGMGIQRKGD